MWSTHDLLMDLHHKNLQQETALGFHNKLLIDFELRIVNIAPHFRSLHKQ